MRKFRINYTFKGQVKTDVINAHSSKNAIQMILKALNNKYLYFKLLNVNMV